LILAKIRASITLGADKIQNLTPKSAFKITPNSQKNPTQKSQQGISGPGKKATTPISLSLSLFYPKHKQKTEQQSESNSAASWTPSPWKASLCHAALRNVAPFLPAILLQSCLCELAE
jgi:hypothetical protein